jgi:viologen exporter family transport system permease protein
VIQSLRRTFNIYRAVAATEAKASLAYNWWVWADIVLTIFQMVIFIYFWNAVYASTATLGGLTLDQTINYILWARILAPLVETRLLFFFGYNIRLGQIGIELTRPLDLQARMVMETYARLAMFIVQRFPLVLVAWLFLGLQLPRDPAQWAAFLVSLVLGQGVLFMFDWILACLAFYVTEVWGMSVVRVAIGSFFGGALIPLVMMPVWLQNIARLMPFAQALSVPVGFLTGITPAAEAPRAWLIQVVWLVVLTFASRRVFDVAVRKVTVQGG